MGLTETNYNRWLNSPLVSENDKSILKSMSKQEIADAFYKDLEFGTAGMRGVIGPGTNRMNTFTVRKATIAFALYLIETFDDIYEKGVVISHDNRHYSREFTLQTAKIFNDFGIKAYIFDALRPTPELSYAVRRLGADGGVMITASHNPREYNGYKIYDETGCQIVPKKIKRLLDIISSLPDELDVTFTPSGSKGELVVLDSTIDDEYVELVEKTSIHPKLDKSNFKIVFTPNHGTGYMNGVRIFKELGYEIYPLEKQCTPDPDFSETLSPNPEDARSFIEPIKYAKEIGAKLIVMTDPDGDRCGLACLNQQGEYQMFTGNQSAAMLMDYIFTERSKKGTLPSNGVMYNTIVTSSLGKKIAAHFGIKTESFLTGFKYIGERIHYYEQQGNGPEFVFGYEESYGCLVEPFVRDKDGLQAITLYSEMANFYDKKGMSLDMVWEMIGKKYGYHEDLVFNLPFPGPEGALKMKELMQTLRDNPFITLDGANVIKVEDYLLSKATTKEGEETPIYLDKSNVIKLYLDDDSVVCVRPSGTEPKVKFYFTVVGETNDGLVDKINTIFSELKTILNLE